MSRLFAAVACCALLASPSALASKVADPGKSRGTSPAATGPSWAQAEIRYVVSHGLMARSVAAFRANDPLTQGELAALVGDLTKQPVKPAAIPSANVTVAQLDARLVRTLQLSSAASAVLGEARAAGLSVPARFGTETIARLLG